MKRIAAFSCTALLLAVPALPADEVERLPSPKQDWIRVDTEHFSLIGNTGERRTASLARDLERFREALQVVTGGLTLNSPLETRIFVFKNGVTMEPYTLDALGGTKAVGGLFVSTPDGNYVVVDASAGEHPFRVVHHEYLHFVMENTIPELPLWLDEGLAEFYSTFEVLGGKAYVGRALRGHVEFLQSGRWLPLEELIRVDHAALREHDQEWVATVYAQSWALTHYLLASTEQQRGASKTLFALIRRGADSREALEQAYGTDLAALEQDLQGYVRGKSGEFGMYIYTPEEAFEEKGVRVSPVERADLLVSLGDLLSHAPAARHPFAREHLRAALELDESLALAHIALARIDIAEEHFDAALGHCAKAQELEPSDPRAHAMHGEALLGRFLLSEDVPEQLLDAPPPLLVEARVHFRKSLELRPDHLPSLAGLGATYFYADEDLTEGVQAFARASQILPSRADYLTNLIVLTARSGNLAGAKSLLDRGLRPRGDAEQTAHAELGIAQAALGRAYRLFLEGKEAQAGEFLEQAQDCVSDPTVREEIATVLEQLASGAAEPDAVDLPAEDAENAGEEPSGEAAPPLRRTVGEARDPAPPIVTGGARENAGETSRRPSGTERYHEALEKFWAGELDEATAILEEILRSGPDQRLRRASEELLADIASERAKQQ